MFSLYLLLDFACIIPLGSPVYMNIEYDQEYYVCMLNYYSEN